MPKDSIYKYATIGLVIIIVVVVVAFLSYNLGNSSGKSLASSSVLSTSVATSIQQTTSIPTTVYTTVPQTQSEILISKGTVFTLYPYNESLVNYNTDIINITVTSDVSSASLTGSYTSMGNVDVMLFTPVQYGVFTQHPSYFDSPLYFSGETQGATINVQNLSPGQYILVFYNPVTTPCSTNSVCSQDTVTVINPITFTWTS